MTVREIAEIAGVGIDTVIRKGKELYPGKFENGKKTVFNQKESIHIMGEIRKKGFIQPSQNAEVPSQNAEVTGSLSPRDLDLISAIVSRTVAMTIQQLDVRLQKIENRVEERQSLLPAPQIKPRDNVSKMVREQAQKTGADYVTVYGILYKEFSYRTNSNPRECAKNRGMSIIDYIDSEGQIETLEAIAIDLWS